jgi:hypothetical protein
MRGTAETPGDGRGLVEAYAISAGTSTAERDHRLEKCAGARGYTRHSEEEIGFEFLHAYSYDVNRGYPYAVNALSAS